MNAKIVRWFGWLLTLPLSAGAAALPEDDGSASTVTIHGRGLHLADVLQRLREQTGNPVSDLRDRDGGGAEPAFDLDLEAAPFLKALDEVVARAGVATTCFTGDGSIGILAAGGDAAGLPPEYDGPFRVALQSITLRRDFQTPSATADIAVEVAWEPRLRPMLLALKSDRVEAKDDQGRDVRPQVAGESGDLALRPENPSVEIRLNLAAPDRSASKLGMLRLRAEVTIPAGLQTFRFPDLGRSQTLSRDDVAATFSGIEVDGRVWKVGVVLEYPGDGPAFESFRQGLFDNRIQLQKADGSTVECNGGVAGSGSDGGRLGFEYLFLDVPGEPKDYQLIYQAPSRVVAVPLDVTFRDVPLP